jgi:malonyl-CoA decarboxylase
MHTKASDSLGSDPVARFHLNNGARLERVNVTADLSKKGLKQSCGAMVNYLYDLDDIESNHESFIAGNVAVSKSIVGSI